MREKLTPAEIELCDLWSIAEASGYDGWMRLSIVLRDCYMRGNSGEFTGSDYALLCVIATERAKDCSDYVPDEEFFKGCAYALGFSVTLLILLTILMLVRWQP